MNSITIAKGSIILDPSKVCTVGYKVISGCLKSYVISANGKEHIIQFAPEEWLIADMESFTFKTKSKIYIEAVEDSVVKILDSNFFPSIESMENKKLINITLKLRNNLIATNKRLISLLSSTSEERYEEFTKTYPQLVQRLPQKLIASYLGMTPEHLSYVRSKLLKK